MGCVASEEKKVVVVVVVVAVIIVLDKYSTINFQKSFLSKERNAFKYE